jgi:hypothetical protein
MTQVKTATPTRKDIDEIIIRSWPKVIFLYPLMLTSFICGIAQALTAEGINSSFAEVAGMIFFIVLCFNCLVISFEFSRFKTLAIFFFFLALFFFLLYLSTRWEVFAFLKDIFRNFHIRLSTSFYIATGMYFLFLFLGVFINTRFNYWVIRSNEILHKEGFLGDVRRYPSPNLKMTKEISDVFEFLLLGSGRIVLYPATEKQAIVLEHVLRVNAAERAIQELLSALSVEIEGGGEAHEHPENEGIGVGD